MGEAAGKGKERWPQVRLGDYIQQVRGVSYTPPDVSDTLKKGFVPLFRAHNIQDDGLNFEDLVYVNKKKISKTQMIQAGDILVCASSGSKNLVGKTAQAQIDYEMSFGAFCKVVRVCNDNLDPIFLGHYFKTPKYRQMISGLSSGANINNIRNEHVANMKIPLPPLPEQRRIAAVLDQVSSLIALRKAQLAKLDLLVKARFVEMFGDPVKNEMGWEVVQLLKLTTKIGSGATPRGGEESYTSEGISLIRSMNVHNGNFKYEKLAHINNEQAKILENVTVEENDILINVTGASVARSCIVPTQILPARVNQHVSIIRCNINRVLPHYLNQLLLNQNYQNLLLSIGGTGGATREAITKQQLEQLPIPLPPLDVQKNFSIFIDTTQMKRHLILSGLNKIEKLYKSLIYENYK